MHKRIIGIINQSTNWSHPFAAVAHVHSLSKGLQPLFKFAEPKQTTFCSEDVRSDPSKHQTSKSAPLLKGYNVCNDKMSHYKDSICH